MSMPIISIETRLDTDRLDNLMNSLPQRTRERTERAAQETVEDIRGSWSGSYPPASSPGQPPAVRSGDLDASIEALPEGEGGDTYTWAVQASAAHGAHVEFGTIHMDARPYFRPALYRLRARFRRYYADLVEVD